MEFHAKLWEDRICYIRKSNEMRKLLGMPLKEEPLPIEDFVKCSQCFGYGHKRPQCPNKEQITLEDMHDEGLEVCAGKSDVTHENGTTSHDGEVVYTLLTDDSSEKNEKPETHVLPKVAEHLGEEHGAYQVEPVFIIPRKEFQEEEKEEDELLEALTMVPTKGTNLSHLSLSNPPFYSSFLDLTPLTLSPFLDGKGSEEPSSLRETREKSETTKGKEVCVPPSTLTPQPYSDFENDGDKGHFENGVIVVQREKPVILLDEKQLSSFAIYVRSLQPHQRSTTQTDLGFSFINGNALHEYKSSRGLNCNDQHEEEVKTAPNASMVELVILGSLHHPRCFGHNFFVRRRIEAIQLSLESLQNFQQSFCCEHFQIPEKSASKLMLNRQCDLKLCHLGNASVVVMSHFPFEPGVKHKLRGMNAREPRASHQWKVFDPGGRGDNVSLRESI